MRRPASLLVLATLFLAGESAAQTDAPPASTAPPEPAGPVGLTGPASVAPIGTSYFPEAPAEAPPPLPRKKGLVLDTGIGGLAFLGKFGNLAPPAPWIHTQLGYEIFKWLMIFGYGELAYTGTSNDQAEASATYFPMYGFGGGLRFTVHVTDRVALFLQGEAGALSAIVQRGTLAFLGYQGAESLGFSVGGKLGVEWYQVDRHMALGLVVGLRDATSFKVQDGQSDTPLMLDASARLRYTF